MKGHGAHARFGKAFNKIALNTRGDLASGIPLAISLTVCFSFIAGIGAHLALNGTETNFWRSERTKKAPPNAFNQYDGKTDNGYLWNPTRSDGYPKDERPKF